MSTAKEIARETLLACLPAGCPSSFREIRVVRNQGSGRYRKITAELIMFDGQPATVEFTPWAFGWSHRFTSLPGGDISFEDGRWQRVCDLERVA